MRKTASQGRPVAKMQKNKKPVPDAPTCWSRRVDSDGPIPGIHVDLHEMFEASGKKHKTKENAELAVLSQGIAVGEQDMPAIGVAYPSLCLEMFTGHSVLQASSCYALGGPTGSFKSHFVLEIANWVARAGGWVNLIENENKYNSDMAQAVMGTEAGKRVWVNETETFNAAEAAMIYGIKKYDGLASGERPPFLQILDSIVGNSTESQQSKLKTEGSVERGFQGNALSAANFLPSYLPMLARKPYFGFWVTHSKDVVEGTGPYAKKTTHLKGGDVWQYRCRIAFVLHRTSLGRPVYEDNNWTVKLKLGLLKDAAVRGYTLPITVRTTTDVIQNPATNDIFKVRKTRFCWDEASVELLRDPEKYGYPSCYKSIAGDILGFEIKKSSGRNYFIAPKIGITIQDQVRDATTIMNALYNSPLELDLLRAEMGIQKGITMQPGDNYLDLLRQARKIAMQRVALLQSADVIYLRKGEFFGG